MVQTTHYGVNTHQGERHAKGFTCWAQFTAMLFCHSLREICNEAGASRDHPGAEQVQPVLRQRSSPRGPVLVDDTPVPGPEPARRAHTRVPFQEQTAVARFDHHQSVPQSVSLGHVPPRQGRRQGPRLVGPRRLPARLRVEMHDARSWACCASTPSWPWTAPTTTTGSSPGGPTPASRRARRPVHRNIHSDAIILLTGPQAQSKCPHLLRRIVTRSTSGRSCCSPITSTSGPRPSPASTSHQAEPTGQELLTLRIQIWTALLALLLLKWLHHLSTAGWSLSNLASMLRLNLFTYRHLRDWLDDPFNTPPLEPVPEQLTLVLS